MCIGHWWLLCNSSSLVSYSHHIPFLYKVINKISTFKKLILEYSGLKHLGWPRICCFLQQETSLPLLSSNRISYKWHEKPENLLLLPSLDATEKDTGFSLWLHFLFPSCKKKMLYVFWQWNVECPNMRLPQQKNAQPLLQWTVLPRLFAENYLLKIIKDVEVAEKFHLLCTNSIWGFFGIFCFAHRSFLIFQASQENQQNYLSKTAPSILLQ